MQYTMGGVGDEGLGPGAVWEENILEVIGWGSCVLTKKN